jgi:hypothetical protein
VTRRHVCRFPTGIATWVYDTEKKKPERVNFDPAVDARVRPAENKKPFVEVVSGFSMLAVGPPPNFAQSTSQLQDAIKNAAGPEKLRLIFAAVFAVFSGFTLGYWLTRSTRPDLQSETVEKKLLDPIFWKTVEGNCHVPNSDGWKFYESLNRIVVESLLDGRMLYFTPSGAVEGLHAIGEYSMAFRLMGQPGLGLAAPLGIGLFPSHGK